MRAVDAGRRFLVAEAVRDGQIDPVIFSRWRDHLLRATATVRISRGNMHRPFATRRKAGEELATKLGKYAHRADVLVLALPRGGVPVAYKVARELDASQIGHLTR